MIPVRVLVLSIGRGYTVTVPAFPDINAQGETEALALQRCRRLIRERLLSNEIPEALVVGQQKLINLLDPVE